MLEYSYPDSQTLKIVVGPPFFRLSDADGCSTNVIIASFLLGVIVFSILLRLFELSFQDNPTVILCGYLVLVATLSFTLDRFFRKIYQMNIFITQEGQITTAIRNANLSLRTTTFKPGCYKLLLEETHETTYDMDGREGEWDAYRVSVVDEQGERFTLFAVKENDHGEVARFEKKFSDFTGLDLSGLRAS